MDEAWRRLINSLTAHQIQTKQLCALLREVLEKTSPGTEEHANLQFLIEFYERRYDSER